MKIIKLNEEKKEKKGSSLLGVEPFNDGKKRRQTDILPDPAAGIQVFNKNMGRPAESDSSSSDSSSATTCPESLKSKGSIMTLKQIRESLNKIDRKAIDENETFYDFVTMLEAMSNKPLSMDEKKTMTDAIRSGKPDVINTVMQQINMERDPKMKNLLKNNTPSVSVQEDTISIDDELNQICESEREELTEGRHDLVAKKCVSIETHHTYWSPYDTKEKDFAKFGIRFRYEDRESCMEAINDPENDLGYNEDKPASNPDISKDDKDKKAKDESLVEAINEDEDQSFSAQGEVDANSAAPVINGENSSEDTRVLLGGNLRKLLRSGRAVITSNDPVSNKFSGAISKLMASAPLYTDTIKPETEKVKDPTTGKMVDKIDPNTGRPVYRTTSQGKLVTGKNGGWENYTGMQDVIHPEDIMKYHKGDPMVTYFAILLRLYYYTFELDPPKAPLPFVRLAQEAGVPGVGVVKNGKLDTKSGSSYRTDMVKDKFAELKKNGKHYTIVGTQKLYDFINKDDFVVCKSLEKTGSAENSDGGQVVHYSNQPDLKKAYKDKNGNTIKFKLKDILDDSRFRPYITDTQMQRTGYTLDEHNSARYKALYKDLLKQGHTREEAYTIAYDKIKQEAEDLANQFAATLAEDGSSKEEFVEDIIKNTLNDIGAHYVVSGHSSEEEDEDDIDLIDFEDNPDVEEDDVELIDFDESLENDNITPYKYSEDDLRIAEDINNAQDDEYRTIYRHCMKLPDDADLAQNFDEYTCRFMCSQHGWMYEPVRKAILGK